MPSPSHVYPAPDLLSLEAETRVDALELRQTLVFGFAAGVSLATFQRILGEARLPPSTFRRAHFERDIFLDSLVRTCFELRIGARAYELCSLYVLRALAEPPRDAAVVGFRQEILAELAGSAPLRASAERVYVGLVALRALFCAGRQGSQSGRRVEILRALKELFDDLAGSFDGAASGLRRLSEFGRAVRDGGAYRRLEALVDHEGNRATVDLCVRVGSDGELRTFQIVGIRENRENPFHSSFLGRLLTRLSLSWRGYRTSAGSIGARLFDEVFGELEEATSLLFQLLGDLEFYLAALGLRDRARKSGLEVCLPELAEPGATAGPPLALELDGLWNPLLLAEATAPVPCGVRTETPASIVMITGPNSGGKTRLLQAIATAQLLGAAGVFVPARAARMPRATGLFVSLLDDVCADQPEGQLGMELSRIRRMFEEIEPGSFVLIDELCSGTNPSEGEEIAELVVSLLPELDAQVFVTTHLLDFAARLLAERRVPRLEFLQVELEEGERPTFRFVPGVARTSLARRTAARLGVTREALVALIEERRMGRAGEAPLAESDPAGASAPRA